MKNAMRNTFLGVLLSMLLVLPWSCQKPDEFEAVRSSNALVTFTAKFMYDESDENEFKGEIDYENHVINVVFPYNYPALSDNVLTMDVLTKLKVQASIENNVIIEPPLLFMDFTKDNVITVIDNLEGTRTDYTVKAEIRKSDKCEITSFAFSNLGISGVVSEKSVSIIAVETIGKSLADVTLSHGATIEPDPRTTAIDWEVEQTLTVTAQNGVDKTVYTVKKDLPAKLATGMRPGSGVIKWTRKLSAISGISGIQKVHGFAITPDGIVLNQQGATTLPVIKTLDGSDAGTTMTVESGTNYFMTSDDSGNILWCNYRESGSGKFTVWKASSISSAPVKLIEYNDPDAGSRLGWKISVQGSVDGDALISSCCCRTGNLPHIAVWKISGGVLESAAPTYIAAPYDSNNYARWSDVVFGGTSLGDDYFISSYAKYPDAAGTRNILWFNGADHSAKVVLPLWNNSVLQTMDFAKFNGSPYLAYSNVNTFTWGVSGSDCIRMHDLSAGTLENHIEVIPPKTYGGQPAGSSNGNGFSDVLLEPSANGFYLNVYFVFAGGYVGMVQYDCFKD